ncbi:rfaE bifunctional protein [Hyphomonas neptunium ATCC 15444]|uniref:Bifunctional protein HldE n=2 Tax=Hyphomonas TaxID=85 RepID=HLDE_HYPNA|nr:MULTISPECIES: D-glycero-beta-D-manno-heptose 1-phosphate adenylyltransferase [Hyphomonas]Q0C190.1 RecName: Full=Bifunctional protein HldE; Includes: RecName: Full=D-beta-D-heptose 7-phosphate kinase; AltName: Full=D-beta-D-heptose 7-phosphotransferase; AltName: Full=D-glycero-beta-D-manno-heptose-7-phosphate kinase; Includes: RecName: Full=D-beta-D-heptose 1-phosphate adenylyltransferase; AltName: Full=D-glycero-beta-D-manno-heptose 1-phosphate adenylyltransferase [Hyphomonas neptunium ATCC 154
MSSRLSGLLDRAAGKRVLCIGDVMLDRFIYGVVDRISPEAPVPVLRHSREASMPGGAANVARNLASLGLEPVLIGACGDDDAGRELLSIFDQDLSLSVRLVTAKGRPTTLKCRFVAGGHQLLRVDTENVAPVSEATEEELIGILSREAPGSAAILISDYAKGLLTDRLLKAVTKLAADLNIPLIADPKGRDFARYGAVDILKPNAFELSAAVHRSISTDEEAALALREALDTLPAKAIIVTRAARGISYIGQDGNVHHEAGRAREVFDVSGAGDTSLAALATAIAGGGTLSDAVHLAIAASGIAVGKAGTATVSAEEIKAALSVAGPVGRAGLLPMDAMIGQVERWRAAGLKIGFTNGCFDILHPGHIRVIEQARAHCDRLVVGLNSDNSVKRLKGPLRPINNEQARADVLSALSAVDGVIIFDTDTPLDAIAALNPDVLVKGGDYTRESIVGADIVEARGGEIVIVPLVAGHSTTAIIARSETGK